MDIKKKAQSLYRRTTKEVSRFTGNTEAHSFILIKRIGSIYLNELINVGRLTDWMDVKLEFIKICRKEQEKFNEKHGLTPPQ